MIVTKPAGISAVTRNGVHLEVVSREIRILQAKLDGLDGTVPQGRTHLLDRLRLIPIVERHLPASNSLGVKPRSAGHVESLAKTIQGVDEPLVVEVVLAFDEPAEIVQQLGIVIENGAGYGALRYRFCPESS